ncbi:MAG TPA: type II secretion system minor pseudopilin GspK [Vulgatibacter sp.]|nr:type II secretion system minor pseudopilin GspK [Vulgatibacter sp.]
MALILVVSSIAVLTAVAVDFAYNTQVDTRLAANARDELRAYYLARSATNFSRLLLSFQHQLDSQSTAMRSQLGDVANQVPGLGALAGMTNLRLWDALPIESAAITGFIEAAAGTEDKEEPPLPTVAPMPGEAVPASGLARFGSFEGGFSTRIEDEEAKVNLNKLDNPGQRGSIAGQQFLLLIGEPRWNFLFDEETSHRERYLREDLLVHLRDWIDSDEVETSLNPINPMELFVDGFGDEKAPYTRYPQRYEPKNARFDSLEEVYLVAGITDRFMAAFGDRLTVYPDINSRLNVNTSDPLQLYMLIQAAAQDPANPMLQNPIVIESIVEQIALVRMLGPMMGITVEQFVTILEAAGIAVRPEIKHSAATNDFLGDKSETFKITAIGQAGNVTKKLVTVLRYDEGLGRLLYYQEE